MWSYVAVGTIASAVSLIEVLTRYPNASRQIAKEWAVWTYLGIHVVASLSVLWLLNNYLPLSLELEQTGNAEIIGKVVVAAFGSLALIRSTVFQARVGDRLIDIGPHAFVTALLNATDRSMDRRHAQYRSAVVTEIMSEVEFDKAYFDLPVHCFNAMISVSAEEQETFNAKLKQIRDLDTISDHNKTLNLGFMLLNIVGEDLLRQAVEDLGKSIQKEHPI